MSEQGDDFAITKKKLERLPEWSHHKVKRFLGAPDVILESYIDGHAPYKYYLVDRIKRAETYKTFQSTPIIKTVETRNIEDISFESNEELQVIRILHHL